MPERKKLTRIEACRKGGLATAAKYKRPHEFYVNAGKKGGRPRLLTLEEIQARELENKNKK